MAEPNVTSPVARVRATIGRMRPAVARARCRENRNRAGHTCRECAGDPQHQGQHASEHEGPGQHAEAGGGGEQEVTPLVRRRRDDAAHPERRDRTDGREHHRSLDRDPLQVPVTNREPPVATPGRDTLPAGCAGGRSDPVGRRSDDSQERPGDDPPPVDRPGNDRRGHRQSEGAAKCRDGERLRTQLDGEPGQRSAARTVLGELDGPPPGQELPHEEQRRAGGGDHSGKQDGRLGLSRADVGLRCDEDVVQGRRHRR